MMTTTQIGEIVIFKHKFLITIKPTKPMKYEIKFSGKISSKKIHETSLSLQQMTMQILQAQIQAQTLVVPTAEPRIKQEETTQPPVQENDLNG